MRDKFDFLHEVKMKVFYKLISLFSVALVRHLKVHKQVCSIFAISEEIKEKSIFCLYIKVKVSYNLILSILVCRGMPKVPKITRL